MEEDLRQALGVLVAIYDLIVDFARDPRTNPTAQLFAGSIAFAIAFGLVPRMVAKFRGLGGYNVLGRAVRGVVSIGGAVVIGFVVAALVGMIVVDR